MSERSELAVLVATESRLDDAIASARHEAAEACEAARARSRLAASQLDTQIAITRAQLATTIAAETARQERELDERADRALARYEAVRGNALVAVARALARRLVAMTEEGP